MPPKALYVTEYSVLVTGRLPPEDWITGGGGGDRLLVTIVTETVVDGLLVPAELNDDTR